LIANAGGPTVALRKWLADISNEDDCAALVSAATSKFGRIDILHNNVGIGALDGDTVKIERSVSTGTPREVLRKQRDAKVPMGRMGGDRPSRLVPSLG
jgi:NAD(P)-dependent dehydrogenase (short-subunit alcohol dehydrogenase family)